MGRTPKVSIITATYNRSEVLQWAIRSVLMQTFCDWELIIMGDACTDNTEEVVASFADPRIRFVNRSVSFKEQSGPNNDGFCLARARLIAYLNHDDLWFPDHLESLIQFLEESSADLVYALPLSIDTNNVPFCGYAGLHYHPDQFIPASLWLLRRELLEELGGWRAARCIRIRNPSQDFIFRAWRKVKRLMCHFRFTAIILPSCSQPNAYRNRVDKQHKELIDKMSDVHFREQLATTISRNMVEKLHQFIHSSWRKRFHSIFNRICIRFGIHPDAARNTLAMRKKGWWIDYLRKVRGLST